MREEEEEDIRSRISELNLEKLLQIIYLLNRNFAFVILDIIFIGSNKPPTFTNKADLDLVIIIDSQTESLDCRFKQDLQNRVNKFNIFLDLIVIQKREIEQKTIENKFIWYLIHEQGFFQYNYLDRIKLTQEQRNYAFSLKIVSLKSELGQSSYKNLLTLAIYLFLEENKLPLPNKLGKSDLYLHFKSLKCNNFRNFKTIKSYITLKDKKEFAPLFNLPTKRKISIFEKLENYINQNL